MTGYKIQDAGCKLHDARCKMQDTTPPNPPLLRGELKRGIVNRVSCIGSYHASRVTHHALRNERGIALVMVLVLSAIMLAIIAALVYMLTSGTQVSGIQKRYKTALEASKGGNDAMYEVIRTRGNSDIPTTICTETWSATCENDKLNKATSSWNAACNSSLTITPTTSTTYDMYCLLGTSPNQYTAYAKIVDTVEGNSGADLGLTKSGVVASNSGEVTVMNIPYLYTIEVDAENASNRAERGKLSVLYQY